MKKRNLSLMISKRKILLLVFMVSILTGMIIASRRTYSEIDYIKDSFYQTVNYNSVKGLLNFTIPKTIPEGYRFYLHVSGRMYMGNKYNIMSFHAFEKESENYSWEYGKTYTFPLKSEDLVECLLVFGLIDKHKQELLYEIQILPNGIKSMKKSD